MSTSTTMKISLPTKMRDDIKALVNKSRYSTTSGFIQDLVNKELRLEKEKAKLNKMVNIGVASGVSEQSPADFFKTLLS